MPEKKIIDTAFRRMVESIKHFVQGPPVAPASNPQSLIPNPSACNKCQQAFQSYQAACREVLSNELQRRQQWEAAKATMRRRAMDEALQPSVN